jgi:hypothetical protein
MYRFIHVGFAFAGVPKIRDLEPAFFALGDDWVRYSALSWIVWTAKPTSELFVRLRPFIDVKDQMLIAPIVVEEAFGTLTPWIWTWMQSKDPHTAILTGRAVQTLLQPPQR